jgi:hypothetical protein
MAKLNNMRIGKMICVAIFSMAVLACETTQETFEEFTKDGEIIYVGSADTVLVGSGYNKLRFWVAINADPKISKGLLKTNDESVMHEFEVVRTKSGNDTISFDLELPEGEYTFGLFLMDAEGNQSVRREVAATVYGDSYKESLINRTILNIDAFADKATLNWADPASNTVTTVLTYEDGAGVMQTVNVPNEATQTTIDNYKLGGMLTVKSSYKPTVNAIEEFEAPPSEKFFPEDFLLDKSLISPLKLAGDASDGCYGSSYARLTDGSTSEFWHSCEDETENSEDLYPWVMSFDLGEPAVLSRFKLDEREGCCGGRSPAAYQIWGTNDISMAETADIDAESLADWEADAQAKGWVKLLDVSGNQNATFEVEVSNDNTYKYLRIVGISSIDGDLVANFSEFSFWGK